MSLINSVSKVKVIVLNWGDFATHLHLRNFWQYLKTFWLSHIGGRITSISGIEARTTAKYPSMHREQTPQPRINCPQM